MKSVRLLVGMLSVVSVFLVVSAFGEEQQNKQIKTLNAENAKLRQENVILRKLVGDSVLHQQSREGRKVTAAKAAKQATAAKRAKAAKQAQRAKQAKAAKQATVAKRAKAAKQAKAAKRAKAAKQAPRTKQAKAAKKNAPSSEKMAARSESAKAKRKRLNKIKRLEAQLAELKG
jgi:hypothetical protein